MKGDLKEALLLLFLGFCTLYSSTVLLKLWFLHVSAVLQPASPTVAQFLCICTVEVHDRRGGVQDSRAALEYGTAGVDII